MNNVKILCIAGSIVLGSILLSGQAFGKAPSDLITLSAPKEPEGQYVSYDIDGSGSYYDSESDTTYYFVKGIVTSYSNHAKTFSLTSDAGETYELPADTDINITDYLNTEAHIWYSEDSQKNLKLLAFSPQIFSDAAPLPGATGNFTAAPPGPGPGRRWRPCCNTGIPPGGPAGAGCQSAPPDRGTGHTGPGWPG